jgi:hypothetical protein
MLFVNLNDGRTENLAHISEICVEVTDVVYYSARGSLDGYREHFDTAEEAQARYEELQGTLLVK